MRDIHFAECDHVIAKVIEVNHCLSGLSAVASGEGSIPCSWVGTFNELGEIFEVLFIYNQWI